MTFVCSIACRRLKKNRVSKKNTSRILEEFRESGSPVFEINTLETGRSFRSVLTGLTRYLNANKSLKLKLERRGNRLFLINTRNVTKDDSIRAVNEILQRRVGN
jgi:hypothetical protein